MNKAIYGFIILIGIISSLYLYLTYEAFNLNPFVGIISFIIFIALVLIIWGYYEKS